MIFQMQNVVNFIGKILKLTSQFIWMQRIRNLSNQLHQEKSLMLVK